MTGKRSSKSLVAQADKLASLIVRAPGYCANCGVTFQLQCAHGFPRTYRNTRWDERNLWALCKACHVYFTYRPLEWTDWMKDRMGLDLYRAVRGAALSPTKIDVANVLSVLKARAEELELV